jgi:CRP-like cAMP-binding protein
VVDPARLSAIPLFDDLTPKQLALVAETLDEVEVPPGKRIARQGDFAYEFFAIEEGTADVEQDGVVCATLGPGDFFGELGLLVSGRRTASVLSTSPMRILAMFEQSFRRLAREVPGLTDRVRAEMPGRFTRPTSRGSTG